MRFTIVTPSYAPDFERAELLVESVRRFAPPDVDHTLLIDRRDMALFRKLEGPRTTLLEVESVLPWWIRRMPGAKRWWLSLKTRPIRNWALQQVVKLTAAAHVGGDVLVFADSDVTFVRPFTTDLFHRDDKVGIARVDFQSPDHLSWLAAAADMLGVPRAEIPPVNFIGNLITWRKDVVPRLHEHLERKHGVDWQRVIARQWKLSEYMVYGLFVEKVLGFEAAGHFPTHYPMLHLSWGYELDKPGEIDRFFRELTEASSGIMIHSKYRLSVDSYRKKVEGIWERSSREPRG